MEHDLKHAFEDCSNVDILQKRTNYSNTIWHKI